MYITYINLTAPSAPTLNPCAVPLALHSVIVRCSLRLANSHPIRTGPGTGNLGSYTQHNTQDKTGTTPSTGRPPNLAELPTGTNM
jgi:hypothetical protein